MNSLEQEVKNKAAQVDMLLDRAGQASQAHGANQTATVEPRAAWRGRFTDSVTEQPVTKDGASLNATTAEEADAAPESRASWADGWGDTWANA